MSTCPWQVGVKCVVLKGSMSMEQRDRMISAFTEDPDVTVFLMSLKAGGASACFSQYPSWLSHRPSSSKLVLVSASELASQNADFQLSTWSSGARPETAEWVPPMRWHECGDLLQGWP